MSRSEGARRLGRRRKVHNVAKFTTAEVRGAAESLLLELATKFARAEPASFDAETRANVMRRMVLLEEASRRASLTPAADDSRPASVRDAENDGDRDGLAVRRGVKGALPRVRKG